MSKRALLVGLNSYPNPDNALRGCLNDVRQMLVLLREHFGFDASGAIRTLTDARATTSAIKDGLRWLTAGARGGDVLVFHYSGHGSQVPDRHGDEVEDGLDEIICPYDLDWDNPFTDDDLHAIVGRVPAGVNLTVVLDCCHAGTGLRDIDSPAHPRRKSLRPPLGSDRASRRLHRFGHRAAEAGALLVAACRDDQVSADAFIDGDYHGALTFYLCEVLKQAGYDTTYEQLVRSIGRWLQEEGFEQDPQLEGPRDVARLAVFSALAALEVGSPRF